MTRRHLITQTATIAAAGAALSGLVFLIVLGGQTTPSTWAGSTMGSPLAAAPVAAVPPSPSAPPSAAATTRAAPGPPSAADKRATAMPAVSARPHLQPYALALGGALHPPLASPTTPVAQPITVDGCDHDYGTPNQCVPITYPAGVTDRCAWLLAHGFGPMKVVGTDTEHLDIDHNGIACDPGDL
jgi:hypothetical protein